MNVNLKIGIAEVSSIIRSGLEAQLKKLPGFRIQFIEITDSESLCEVIRSNKPDILIMNPLISVHYSVKQLKEECGTPSMKCIALLYHLTDKALLKQFDEEINIFDSPDEIRQKLEQLCVAEAEETEDPEEPQALSIREKEIVVCVVKGMTNREIAGQLFLSTHTVITHRRNIARKLQIHSASGLTVYAIVNKLVELSDINHKTL